MDDNAAGLGVMLELAARLKDTCRAHCGIRFIATSGKKARRGKFTQTNGDAEEEKYAAGDCLDNLIVGDEAPGYNSGKNTPEAVRHATTAIGH